MKPYYQREGVVLYHGDSLEVLRELKPGTVDALITDPPYSSGGQFRGDRNQSTGVKYLSSDSGQRARLADFGGDNRDGRSWAFWATLWLGLCQRVLAPGALAAVFTDWRQLPTLTDAFQAGGLVWRGVFVWDKGPGARPMNGRYRGQAEYAVWGTNGPAPIDRSRGCGLGVVQENQVAARRRHHQTEKPVALLRQMMVVLAPDSLVLDPFAGSGSTLLAALEGGHRAIGVEASERYAEVTATRLEAACTGQVVATPGQGGLF